MQELEYVTHGGIKIFLDNSLNIYLMNHIYYWNTVKKIQHISGFQTNVGKLLDNQKRTKQKSRGIQHIL